MSKHPTEQEIQDWLIAEIARSLKVQPGDIGIQDPFVSYGLDSRTTLRLVGQLEDWLGLQLSATLAYEYPTIWALARHLASELDSHKSKRRGGTTWNP